MRAIVAAALVLCFAVAAHAQMVPWTVEFRNKNANFNATATRVPNCNSLLRAGAAAKNCWTQDAGAPNVKVTDYFVSNAKFPCTSGSSATTWVFDTTIQLDDADCPATCSGFGCKNGDVNLCNDIGLPSCPQPAGHFESVGKSSDCQKGLGDYTIKIACPKFTITTKISY